MVDQLVEGGADLLFDTVEEYTDTYRPLLFGIGAFCVGRYFFQNKILPAIFSGYGRNCGAICNGIVHLGALTATSVYEILNAKRMEAQVFDPEGYEAYPDHLLAFYLFCMAFHFQSAIMQPDDGIGVSMWIHHFLTVILLTFSWWTNHLMHGLFVLYIHDVSDIPMFTIRLLRAFDGSNRKNENSGGALANAQIFMFPSLVVVWFYLRIYYFAKFIHGLYYDFYGSRGYMYVTDHTMVYALCGLWCLNLYWLFFMLHKAYGFIFAPNIKRK